MKKRIKMTDKELAIAMWVYVKERIKNTDITCIEKYESITDIKQHFLAEHGKGKHYWYNACLLCQRYVSEASLCNCPLSEDGKDCGFDSSWFAVTNYARDEEFRQEALVACDKIIAIMEAEDE